jgi:hypothetical protein
VTNRIGKRGRRRTNFTQEIWSSSVVEVMFEIAHRHTYKLGFGARLH